jgi:hypothetical protein
MVFCSCVVRDFVLRVMMICFWKDFIALGNE